MEAGHQQAPEIADLIFLYVATTHHPLEKAVLPVVRHAGVPVVVWNRPTTAVDAENFNRSRDRTRMTEVAGAAEACRGAESR